MHIYVKNALIDKARTLIDQGLYVDAKAILEDVAKNCSNNVALAESYILVTKANIYLGDYNEKFVDSAIDLLWDSNENALFAEAKAVKARLYVARSNYVTARELYNEAYVCFLRSRNNIGAADALNHMGFISLQIGDLAAATNYVRKSIDLYSACGDELKAMRISINLALLHLLSGQINDATLICKGCFNSMTTTDESSAFRYYLVFGIAKALEGNIIEAKRIVSETTEYSETFKREKTQYWEYLGWIHILAGEFNEAEKALLAGLELSLKIAPESALISQTKRLLADAYLGLKKFDLAQKYAEEALIVAEKINERAEIAACWRVFAQTALQKGEKDNAREWFKKAIDLFAQISSRYELAVTRYLAAVSGLYGNGERAAFLYLAKEYFESEDIRPYIEKINAVLTVTPPRPAPRPSSGACPVFVAAHPATRKIRALAENIAASEMTVLLTGPTGTGKDQLAAYIHFFSGRAGKFVSVNAAAIPDSMVESELFGYRKGAFTGADRDKAGLFEEADGGTFYLNEIADTTSQFQAKLLEVLETKSVRRLGANELRKVNFRLIAATNQNLEEAIRGGRFRADLYHRLNEIPITLPPLAERSDDIPALVAHFLAECGLDLAGDANLSTLKEICRILQVRPWTGNVRELRVEVRRLCLTCSGDFSRMLEFLSESNQTDKEKLLKTLKESDWNQREAARRLGLTEGGVRYQMRKYDIGNDPDA